MKKRKIQLKDSFFKLRLGASTGYLVGRSVCLPNEMLEEVAHVARLGCKIRMQMEGGRGVMEGVNGCKEVI